jgi:hypothetical protein
MGPGSHVGFPISAKNKNLVYDHTMNISAKFDMEKMFKSSPLKPVSQFKANMA